MAVLAGCNDPDEPGVDDERDLQANICLDISLINRDALSSRGGTVVDDLNYFEAPVSRYEQISTMRIIIVDANGRVEHNRLLSFDSPVINTKAVFKVKPLETKQIYLFGNELPRAGWEGNGYYDFSSIRAGQRFPVEEISALTVGSATPGTPMIDNTGATRTYLPINEHFERTLTATEPGTEENPSETFALFVTRSGVKFSVEATYDGRLTAPSSLLTVDSVKINAIGNREYLLPTATEYYPSKSVEATTEGEGRFITAYKVPESGVINSIITLPTLLTFPTSGQGKSVYAPEIYYPETQLATGLKYQIQIVTGVASVAGALYSDWVDLPNLDDLPRNTHVIIRLHLEAQTLRCVVDLLPYREIELKPQYGDFNGTSPVISWPTNPFDLHQE
ncbi:MAG: hypothetical protein K2M05_06570 [Paramuribaculum sp.]|nr:hypothetical protein [Paramuribaculum sp.]